MVDAVGINVKAVFSLVFAFGALLAGLAGVMGGAFLALYPGADFEILTYALVVVVIGGPGSLLGDKGRTRVAAGHLAESERQRR